MAVAACGGGENRKVDAGVTPDQQDIDAPTAGDPVEITVTSAGVGIEGVRVHFQGPDSSVISTTMTDATGKASALMPNGGYVTAINPFASTGGTFVDIRTFAGVEPGDDLVLKDSLGGQVTDVLVTFPTDNDNTVTQYVVFSPCDTASITQSGSGASVSLGLYGACLTGTDLLVASANANDEIVHWLFLPNVTPVNDAIDLSSMTLTQTPVTKTYTINNIVSSSRYDVRQELWTAKGLVFEGETFTNGPSGAPTLTVPNVSGAVDVVIGETEVSNGLGGHVLVNWGAPSTAITVDVAPRLLAEVTDLPTFDATTHKVAWQQAATGQTPDFAISYTHASRSALFIEWSLIAPYTAGSAQFPTLPPEGSLDYNFLPTDTIGVDFLIFGKVPGGYDAVRETILTSEGPQDVIGTSTSGALEIEQVFTTGTRTVGPKVGGRVDRTSVAPAWMLRRRM